MSATILTLQPRPADPSVDHAIQAIVTGASTAETCNTDLAAGPWNFDDRPGYGPGSSMGDVIPTGSPRQGELPGEYREASPEELDARIRAAKANLGGRVMILGHHYQREEMIRFADYVGDSFKLADAAGAPGSRVHRLLRRALHGGDRRHPLAAAPEGRVLPNMSAGCSMADMADMTRSRTCWEELAKSRRGPRTSFRSRT